MVPVIVAVVITAIAGGLLWEFYFKPDLSGGDQDAQNAEAINAWIESLDAKAEAAQSKATSTNETGSSATPEPAIPNSSPDK